jgi:hypothetical protein
VGTDEFLATKLSSYGISQFWGDGIGVAVSE